MFSECHYFQLATDTLHWLINFSEINEFLVKNESQGGYASWTVPNSDIRVEMSFLGKGSFAYVWKARLFHIYH